MGAALAGCCTSQCFGALVVRNRRVAAGLQQRFASSSPPLMLLPLDSGPSPADTNEHGKLRIRSHAARFLASLVAAPPGLVGFAANLVELRDRHRVLRASVVHALFGDALVFRTVQDACAFRERLLRNRVRNTPLIVCLDGERLPPEGAVFAGQRCLAAPDSGNVFGKASATESTEFAML